VLNRCTVLAEVSKAIVVLAIHAMVNHAQILQSATGVFHPDNNNGSAKKGVRALRAMVITPNAGEIFYAKKHPTVFLNSAAARVRWLHLFVQY
jgi:hypothetical protein